MMPNPKRNPTLTAVQDEQHHDASATVMGIMDDQLMVEVDNSDGVCVPAERAVDGLPLPPPATAAARSPLPAPPCPRPVLVLLTRAASEGHPGRRCVPLKLSRLKVTNAPTVVHPQRTRIVVLREGALCDARVQSWLGKERGNRHLLLFEGESEPLPLDLNVMNHARQRFESVAEYEAHRRAYIDHILTANEYKYVEDAITGNRLEVASQLLNIGFKEHDEGDQAVSGLRWKALGDAKPAAGSEFVNSVLASRLDASQLEFTQRELDSMGVAGLRRDHYVRSAAGGATFFQPVDPHEKWRAVQTIKDLAALLVVPSTERMHGAHPEAQPVLVSADPGTGKTWSMQQCIYLLAEQCKEMPEPRLVPVLVYVRRLARSMRMQRRAGKGLGSNLIREYLIAEYKDDEPRRNMLLQAYEMRTLVVLLDGIDEASGLKEELENFMLEKLAPMRVRLVVTSRPEGIRLQTSPELYNGWVVMNLRGLDPEQQKQAIDAQVRTRPRSAEPGREPGRPPPRAARAAAHDPECRRGREP